MARTAFGFVMGVVVGIAATVAIQALQARAADDQAARLDEAIQDRLSELETRTA